MLSLRSADNSKIAMDMVKFRCYLSAVGEDEIDRWFCTRPSSAQAAIYAVLETLRHRPAHRWRRKPFARLHGFLCSGLGEIRVEEPDGTHYRVLGYFSEPETTFTLLYAFRKSDDPSYDFACPEAQRRRRTVEADPGRAGWCQIGGW